MVYVIYNDSTKEIYTASVKDDTVVPSGYTKVEEAGDSLESLGLDDNVCNYKYIDNDFVLNQDKIDADAAAAEQQATDAASANTKLIDLGLTQDEIDALKQS